jgi:hypothetical protein
VSSLRPIVDGACRDVQDTVNQAVSVFYCFSLRMDVVSSWHADAFDEEVRLGGLARYDQATTYAPTETAWLSSRAQRSKRRLHKPRKKRQKMEGLKNVRKGEAYHQACLKR